MKRFQQAISALKWNENISILAFRIPKVDSIHFVIST